MTVDIRRAADRLHTETEWLDARHCFSFGSHYDPDNTHFGLLLVSNDHTVSPGAGFDTHPHRDMEIITWVLCGALSHNDSAGNAGVIYPGLAQRMSAGSGVLHSERNAGDEPARFVQMWVPPDEPGLAPGYEQLDVGAEVGGGGLVLVASGMAKHSDTAAIGINQRHAALHVARLPAGGESSIPRRRLCTCSSPTARSSWKLMVSCGQATLRASPWLTANAWLLATVAPKCWCGRCTPR